MHWKKKAVQNVLKQFLFGFKAAGIQNVDLTLATEDGISFVLKNRDGKISVGDRVGMPPETIFLFLLEVLSLLASSEGERERG